FGRKPRLDDDLRKFCRKFLDPDVLPSDQMLLILAPMARRLDAAKQQATLAQCKGEAATTLSGNTAGLVPSVKRASDENTIINACMARNGYIQAQQCAASPSVEVVAFAPT